MQKEFIKLKLTAYRPIHQKMIENQNKFIKEIDEIEAQFDKLPENASQDEIQGVLSKFITKVSKLNDEFNEILDLIQQ